jgi:hypothetical protein
MKLINKPNNLCTVGWSKWDIGMSKLEFKWLKEQLKKLEFEPYTCFYSASHIQGDWTYRTIGIGFPTEFETAVLILIQSRGE